MKKEQKQAKKLLARRKGFQLLLNPAGIRQSLLEYANISIRQQSGCIEECPLRRKNWMCAEDSSFKSISDIHHQKEDLTLALGSVYAWTDWTSIRFSTYRDFLFLSEPDSAWATRKGNEIVQISPSKQGAVSYMSASSGQLTYFLFPAFEGSLIVQGSWNVFAIIVENQLLQAAIKNILGISVSMSSNGLIN